MRGGVIYALAEGIAAAHRNSPTEALVSGELNRIIKGLRITVEDADPSERRIHWTGIGPGNPEWRASPMEGTLRERTTIRLP